MAKLTPRILAKFETFAETIRDIIASRNVGTFCIGISRRPTQRKAAYRRWLVQTDRGTLRGFVILDWDHTPDTALDLEQWLFSQFGHHRKYVNREDVKYFSNANRGEGQQYVYVAWW